MRLQSYSRELETTTSRVRGSALEQSMWITVARLDLPLQLLLILSRNDGLIEFFWRQSRLSDTGAVRYGYSRIVSAGYVLPDCSRTQTRATSMQLQTLLHDRESMMDHGSSRFMLASSFQQQQQAQHMKAFIRPMDKEFMTSSNPGQSSAIRDLICGGPSISASFCHIHQSWSPRYGHPRP